MDRNILKDLMALVLLYDQVVFKLLYLDKGEIFDLKNALEGINKAACSKHGERYHQWIHFFGNGFISAKRPLL